LARPTTPSKLDGPQGLISKMTGGRQSCGKHGREKSAQVPGTDTPCNSTVLFSVQDTVSPASMVITCG
jgi:hypothetical protein